MRRYTQRRDAKAARGRRSPGRAALRFVTLLGAVFLVLAVAHNLRLDCGSRKRTVPTREALESTLLDVVARHGIEKGAIHTEEEWLVIAVPEGESAVGLAEELVHAARAMGVNAKRTGEPSESSAHLVFSADGRLLLRCQVHQVPPPATTGPQIALVIDDFGYSLAEHIRDLLQLPCALTVSVIPGLPFSKEVAELAAASGKEVMVHMPMEALHEQVEDRGFTLFVALSDEEVRARVRRGIAGVPHARGLNNHQGSRATADERVMNVLMEELRAQGLYFVDSRTNNKSVAAEVASRLGVPCVANGAFLDVDPDTASVRQQLWRLAQLAGRRGGAVGIGHARRNTLEVLRREIPKLAHQGYEFVAVSGLLHVPAPPIALAEAGRAGER